MTNSKILLIDDDLLVSKTLRLLFQKKAYSVDCAANAIEALTLAAVNEYDIVISDIRMPGENGVIAVEKIKKIYQDKHIYCGFIFISGYAEEDTPAHAVRLGVTRFLFKPFSNDAILKSIEQELELVRQERLLKNPSHLQKVGSVRTVKPRFNDLGVKRVVVTGVGVISPSGIGKDEYWTGLAEGKNCVGAISYFDSTPFPSKASAEARSFRPEEFIEDKGEIRRMGRTAQFGVAAANLAVKDAFQNRADKLPTDAGVILGSAIAGLEYVETDFRALERGGVRKVRPYLGIAGFAGGASSEISRSLSIKGASITISTGCTSATDAMGYAFNQIRFGKATTLITGGADASVTSGILAAFCQMGAVSMWQNDLHRASRPFNKDRGGFVLGEGSWVFVFEEYSEALKRGAKIYCEIIGYGATCDAWHMAKPHPSGDFTAQAIQLSIDDAGIPANSVDLFEAYGNGTPLNDSYETGVIKKVFGEHAYKLMVPSIKSMLGHPLGASGGQQLAAAIMAFQEGIVHPTINYEVPDPECDLDYVSNSSRSCKVDIALCSSIAFGAKNSALIARSIKK